MKNSKVWHATDTTTSAYLGRFLSPTAREALKLVRELLPHAVTIRVVLVKR